MIHAEPWQTAETPGSMRSLPITRPEIITSTIQRSKRLLLIVGHDAIESKKLEVNPLDYAIQISKETGAHIVATAHIINEFIKRGFQNAFCLPIVDITNRLKDPNWQGLDGQGQYDLVLFIGIPYYLQWVTLSALKHYALHLKTIALDRFHQPHATWSFPNMTFEDWQQQLETIVTLLKDAKTFH